MTTVEKHAAPAAVAERGPRGLWLVLSYALTVLVSAFLLFQVQPLISKFILPWFGGGPSVWTTCMLFFQLLLFGGYAYAHLLVLRLKPAAQVIVHVTLLVAALAVLPITPGEGWKPVTSDRPTASILVLLAACVGLPYFVLSSTGPLMQAWFRRSYPGRSPYRLYALSNAGSLAALLSYPFVFEPSLDLSTQARFWSWGFAVFALLCAICTWAVWQRRNVADVGAVDALASSTAGPSLRPSFARRLSWLGLAACASIMLLATTNHLCQDVAVIPFLWVAPLSLYLFSFIVAFDHERWYHRRVFGIAAMVAILAVASATWFTVVAWQSGQSFDFYQQLFVYFSALFLICMICHGELARLRPDPAYLTSFYLIIAAGGAIGGILVTLVAPLVFSTFLEWQIGLIISFLLAAVAAFVGEGPATAGAWRWRAAVAILLIVGVAVALGGYEMDPPIYQKRTFYGVLTVADSEPKGEDMPPPHRVLRNGTIIHGAQFKDPRKHDLPLSYYPPHSGVGKAIRYFQARGPVRVGAIGLGTGTIAAFMNKGDLMKFYEINPEVVNIAKTHFTFLEDCQKRGAQYQIALGDARLVLEREKPQNFDVLVVDAFSGDAIPTHLLTVEAFKIYLRHLKPDGVIAVHVSNRYIGLAPVAYALAEHYHLGSARIETMPVKKRLHYGTEWILISANQDFLKDLPKPSAGDLKQAKPLWTDNMSNLFELLR